jgi:hypothetical protein
MVFSADALMGRTMFVQLGFEAGVGYASAVPTNDRHNRLEKQGMLVWYVFE